MLGRIRHEESEDEFPLYLSKRPLVSKEMRMRFNVEIFVKLRYREYNMHFDIRIALTSSTTRLVNEQKTLNEYGSDSDSDFVVEVILAQKTIRDALPHRHSVIGKDLQDIKMYNFNKLIEDKCRMKKILHLGYLHGMRMFRNLKECDRCRLVISEHTRCDHCTLAAKRQRRG